jgi:hypothetical protein
MKEWISVKVKTPEVVKGSIYSADVLGYDDSWGYMYLAVYIPKEKKWLFSNEAPNGVEIDITHWMDLPDAPHE